MKNYRYTYYACFTGNATKRRRVDKATDDLLARLSRIQSTPLPPRPPDKGFNPANPEIPILKDYGGHPKKSFWEVFPVHRNWRSGTPFKLDVKKIGDLVKKAGSTDINLRVDWGHHPHGPDYSEEVTAELVIVSNPF